jgi:hypothetical protein
VEGLLVEVRLESIVRIRERGKFVHEDSFFLN